MSSNQARSARGTLIVECETQGAEVWLDESFVGVLHQNAQRFQVVVGEHRLEIRDDGHHSDYREVTVHETKELRVRVELATRFE